MSWVWQDLVICWASLVAQLVNNPHAQKASLATLRPEEGEQVEEGLSRRPTREITHSLLEKQRMSIDLPDKDRGWLRHTLRPRSPKD